MNAKISFISAGAGSGKTYRLTQLLHSQLSSGATRPSGVIATTFTKKAATELRERVRSHLLVQNAWGLANAMGQARIGSVNSVCGGLLERFAFEAGLSTGQQVLEEDQASHLIRKAIDVVADGPTVSALVKLANRLGIEDWQGELKALVDQARANDIAPDQLTGFATKNSQDLLGHFPKPAQEDLTDWLLKAINSILPELAEAAITGKKKNTNAYLGLIRAMEGGLKNGNVSWGDWVKLSKTFPQVALQPLAEQVNSVAARFAENPALHADIADYLARMFALCADVLRVYGEIKRETGVLDFTDQEHLLLKVLDDPGVASTLSEELDLLLVDEFQDTSPIQLALFLKLANCAKAVYWVGDIKQAIYGFRGSDPQLIEVILNALPGMNGDKEILGDSWRSRPPLVQLVNSVFSHAFGNTLKVEEVELAPQREEITAGPAFANWLLNGTNIRQEALALARGVRQLVDSKYMIFEKTSNSLRPVCHGDIAILCRSNDDVKKVASALRSVGIPTATSQPGLLATPEAVLALACLRRLNDPSDTIATAEILALADCQEPETWVADRLKHLANDGNPNTWREKGDDSHPILTKLAVMRAELPLLAPREALQAVIDKCGLPARVLRWKHDPTVARMRLANLEALLEMACRYEEVCQSTRHSASISGLILWFNEQQGGEADSLAEPAIDAVKVMTHHAAKGLEWPVAILMDLHKNIRDRLWSVTASSRDSIDMADPLKNRFIRYWPWPFGPQKNVSMADKIALTQTAKTFREAAIEEAKRLLYVSMTRARDLLVLARSSRKPTGEWLDTLDAPWLLPQSQDGNLTLPSGGNMPATRWELAPLETEDIPAHQNQPIQWFDELEKTTPKLPLVFNPSQAAPAGLKAIDQVRIGERIGVASGTDMADLGTALHACIAAAFTDRKAPLSIDDVNGILIGFGVGDKVSPQAVLKQIGTLQAWIKERWGIVKAFAEIPVESLLDTGQVMLGRIDLLLELDNGWVLIDHKSNPQGAEHWEALATEHAGQLDAYRASTERATGKPVLESWLFLPVAAGAVRVQL